MLNFVVTMAGLGTRFASEGFTLPKPLIEVHGRPMYSVVTNSLPLQQGDRLIFVCLEEHLRRYPLKQDIEMRFSNYRPVVVSVSSPTRGQACTAALAIPELSASGGVVIHNADTLFHSSLLNTLRTHHEADGVLGVFRTTGDHWSFVRLDADGRVVETAEKRRISEWASTGLYYFRSISLFETALAEAINETSIDSEIYIAPMYNTLIRAGYEVRVDIAESVNPLGTPRELSDYLARGSSGG